MEFQRLAMKTFYIFMTVLLAVAADESPALKELKSGNLKFSANVYKELVQTNAGKNFLVCPLSVEVVLALTEAGAAGQTAQQLITGLNLPDTEEKIHAAFKELAPSLNVAGEYTLASANKVYVKEGYTVQKQFKEIATSVFNAEVSEINFEEKEAAEKINKWVLEKTHDKIKDLISKSDLSSDTRAVLINALYFHGLWEEPFYVDNTSEKPFKLSGTEETKVKMMEQTKQFAYHEDANLKVKYLEMRYNFSPISPDEVDGLAAVENNIEQVLNFPKFGYEKVHVQIPHVNIESSLQFIPILNKLGVTDAFDSKANFSRLLETDEELQISKIIQKTFIAVEEKGTTAAAATAVVVVNYSLMIDPPEDPKEFEANRPFIFVVRSDNGILFVGRFLGPNK